MIEFFDISALTITVLIILSTSILIALILTYNFNFKEKKITLFTNTTFSNCKWADGYCKIYTTVTVYLILSFNNFPYFSVSLPNKNFNGRNIFKLLLQALISETIAAEKYIILKDKIYKRGLHKQL